MIVFRVNGSNSSGIGHIKRAIKLANSLKKKYKIVFLVDAIQNLPRHFVPSSFKIVEVYPQKSQYISEEGDANLCINILESESKISAVVVDDYRFSKVWEKIIRKNLTPNLCAFDDRGDVEHCCSVLVDSKYDGRGNSTRYEGKTNPECIKLLGPNYFFSPQRVKDEYDDNRKRSVLITLGGGGNLEIMLPVINKLLDDIDREELKKIYLIEGPFSENAEKIKRIIKDSRLIIIKNAPDLTEYLTDVSVYIGSSGTTLFEALSLGCSCLSFSIAQNQLNDKKNLEDLGHYFHINNFENCNKNDFALLCKNFYLKRERIKELQKSANVKLDEFGVERVSNQLQTLIRGDDKVVPMQHKYKEKDKKGAFSKKNDKYFRKINDKDVNAYLYARNLKKNSDNMTINSLIPEVEHYNWWLTNERESYVMEHNGKPILYIWHQTKIVDSELYLFGGWFIASEKTSPLDVMVALKYQLNLTNKTYPNVTWLAIIKKTNKFVKKLNEKYGFKMTSNEKFEIAIEKIFNKVDKNSFDFYYK